MKDQHWMPQGCMLTSQNSPHYMVQPMEPYIISLDLKWQLQVDIHMNTCKVSMDEQQGIMYNCKPDFKSMYQMPQKRKAQ